VSQKRSGPPRRPVSQLRVTRTLADVVVVIPATPVVAVISVVTAVAIVVAVAIVAAIAVIAAIPVVAVVAIAIITRHRDTAAQYGGED